MKRTWILLAAALLFPILCGAKPNTVITLTAADVTDAQAIEGALRQATGNGAHPGTVLLDSSAGDFVFSGDDRSINIFLSNATLASKNGAVIANCADGIFFDGLPADRITIQGITFHCTTNGLIAVEYLHRGVNILNNTFEVESYGIGINTVRDWKISGNIITAGTPVQLGEGATQVKISQNTLDGTIGIYLQNADGNQIQANEIRAQWQGVLLGYGSSQNKIIGNTIRGVENAAFGWEGENSGNQVHGNRAACRAGATCLLINALEEFQEGNQFSGNRWLK